MLTKQGCEERRRRLWGRIPADVSRLVLADPIHLRYLANFHVDPFSLGGDFGGLLEMHRDGRAVLHHDNRLPGSVDQAHVDDRNVIEWYGGGKPGRGPRRLVLKEALGGIGGRINDSLTDMLGAAVTSAVAEGRRSKDADEVELLKTCMRAGAAGHAWARENVKPGMTEVEVYAGVAAACVKEAGRAAIVYGDFAVSPGPSRRGGPPTGQKLQAGQMMILDFSVVLFGYRSDFTNTLCVGRAPTAEQKRLYDLCSAAMRAGEERLKAGARCLEVYEAVYGSFVAEGMAESFTHHAGHGLGLGHPEAPFFVKHADEILTAGDVVTLEPGLYIGGTGGIRIEHNYLITEKGYERLSDHTISLT